MNSNVLSQQLVIVSLVLLGILSTDDDKPGPDFVIGAAEWRMKERLQVGWEWRPQLHNESKTC